MDYLKRFNLNDNDIDEIISTIDELDYNELFCNREKVTSILNYFISLGISDIKSILLNYTDILHDELDYIKSKLDNNTINLIKEDISNLDLLRN